MATTNEQAELEKLAERVSMLELHVKQLLKVVELLASQGQVSRAQAEEATLWFSEFAQKQSWKHSETHNELGWFNHVSPKPAPHRVFVSFTPESDCLAKRPSLADKIFKACQPIRREVAESTFTSINLPILMKILEAITSAYRQQVEKKEGSDERK
jgi:hypothetical protein